jgi:hypothetical protein
MSLHFSKDKEKLLLFACRVGMWETPSVFHISTRFSFFASFFLFLTSFLFVENYTIGVAADVLNRLLHRRLIGPV